MSPQVMDTQPTKTQATADASQIRDFFYGKNRVRAGNKAVF